MGKEWFRGKQVANILGYRVAERFTRIVSFEENISTHNVGSGEIKHNESFVNEFALYEVVCKINKTDMERYNKAREFQKWFFGEVLPSIRKNNFYVDNENITKEQLKNLQKEIINLVQQRDNFKNILVNNKKKKQRLKTFLKDMFPECRGVHEQFLENMRESGVLDKNNQPTQKFIKMNKKACMYEHNTIISDRVTQTLMLTNKGMASLCQRLYLDGGKLRLKDK